jgi:hypothetical protein
MGEHFNKLMWSLIDAGATDFVETGTMVGTTSGAVAEQRDLPVWTCEPNPDFAAMARARLPERVRFYAMRSEEFLPLVIPQLGALPLFFLDAHGWGGGDPLLAELALVRDLCHSAAVIVHDFRVPGRPEFRYCVFDGGACDFGYVGPALGGHDYRCYLPDYDPPPGSYCTGYLLLFQDSEPFGNLSDVKEWTPC